MKKKKETTKKKSGETKPVKAKKKADGAKVKTKDPDFRELVKNINLAKHPELKPVENRAFLDFVKAGEVKPVLKLSTDSPAPSKPAAAAEKEEKKKNGLVLPKFVIKIQKAGKIAKDVIKVVHEVKKENGGTYTMQEVNQKLKNKYDGIDPDIPGTENGGNLLLLGSAFVLGYIVYKKTQ